VVRLEHGTIWLSENRGDQLGLELVAVLQRPGDAPVGVDRHAANPFVLDLLDELRVVELNRLW